MRLLDRSVAYGQVINMGGVAYEQRGVYYDGQGRPVKVTHRTVVRAGDQEPVDVYDLELLPIDDGPDEDEGLEKLGTKRLKALVESFGGTYTTRAAALVFLEKGQSAKAAA